MTSTNPAAGDHRSTEPGADSTEARLAGLERTLAALAAEVASLRTELRTEPRDGARRFGYRPGSNSADRAPSARSSRGDRRRRDLAALDLEGLLGRYGMLIIAALAAAGAVGTFLSWAIGRGYLRFSPAARVAIGILVAAGVGAWGLRLRRRERSFGSSILGLALAIALVCAYAAGPAFKLVPLAVAFIGAAVISWALALFALHEQDEPLWCVGLAGAALAPFATSGGDGNVFALLAYGVIVTLPAGLAIAQRVWPVAWRLFYIVAALYTLAGAALGAERGIAGVVAALAFPFVIAVGAVVPFAPDQRKRGAVRWLVGLGLLGAAIMRVSATAVPFDMAAAMTGAVLAALAIVDSIADVPQSSIFAAWRAQLATLDWLDAAVLPSLFLYLFAGAALGASWHSALYTAGVLAFSVFSCRRALGALRDASAAAASLAALALVDAFHQTAPAHIAALVVAALVAFALHVARPSRGWMGGGAALMAIAAIDTVTALTSRAAYHFTPFTTTASLAAAAVLIGCIVIASFRGPIVDAARRARGNAPPRPDDASPDSTTTLRRALAAAPWVWAFVWVLIELSMAYSPSTSTLLLVVYFAATGVASVAAGRARQLGVLRKIGLGLALVAAATAIYGASTYFDFAARISAYLVTSVFLLGIAYWYRRPGAGIDGAGGVGEPAGVE